MKGASGGYTPRPQTEKPYSIERVEALENLREVAAMNCEQLPAEVREALHAVPGIEATHPPHEGKE